MSQLQPSQLQSADLVERLRAGDAAAFEALFHAYHAPLCAFACRYVGARRRRREQRGSTAPREFRGPQQYPTPPKLVFESVLEAMSSDRRVTVVQLALEATENAGVTGAGSITFLHASGVRMNTDGLVGYEGNTYGEFSLTARTKDGRGSGWAWGGFEDWAVWMCDR